jgi:hypothetical protein
VAALEDATACLAEAAQLVANIKREHGTLSLDDARRITSIVRETLGWLSSALKLLDPEHIL